MLSTSSIKSKVGNLNFCSNSKKPLETSQKNAQIEKLDVLFIVANENDAAVLRYVMRSYIKHAKNIGRIAVAGIIPKWLKTGMQYQACIDSQAKTIECIASAAKKLNLSKNFIYAKPNILLTKDIDIATTPFICIDMPLPDNLFYSTLLSSGKSASIKTIPMSLHRHILACEVLKANNLQHINTSASPFALCSIETAEKALSLKNFNSNADAMCIIGNIANSHNAATSASAKIAKTISCADEIADCIKLGLPCCMLDSSCFCEYENQLRTMFSAQSCYESAYGQKIAVLIVCADDDSYKLSIT